MTNKKRFQSSIRIVIYDQSKRIFDKFFDSYPIVIGRSPSCDIPLPNYDFLSRQHCAVTEEDQSPVLVDLNSTNGFTFQGQKAKKAPLIDGVEIVMGTLRVVAERQAQSEDPLSATANFKIPETGASVPVAASQPVPTQAHATQSASKAASLNIPRFGAPTAEPRVEVAAAKTTQMTQPAASTSHTVQAPQFAAASGHDAAPTAHTSHSHGGHHSSRPLETPVGGAGEIAPNVGVNQLRGSQRVLEGYVTWKDQVYDVQHFRRGTRVTGGRGMSAGLKIPTLKWKLSLATFDWGGAKCFVPNGATVELTRGGQKYSMNELMSHRFLGKKGSGHVLKMDPEDLVSIQLDPSVQVHFRFAPAPRSLSRHLVGQRDEEFQKAATVSGLFHLFIAILAMLNAPPMNGPKLENVAPKYAKLLVAPPKPKPEKKKEPPKVEPKKEPPKEVKKEQPKPKKVVLKESPVLTKMKQPPKITPKAANTVGKPEKNQKPVDIQSVGALAALSALSTNMPTNIPASINVNPNAGGKPGPQTAGIISSLSMAGGKLPPGGGMGGLKTKGLGYGTGTGYGTQGLAGKAGQMGVAGAVRGAPSLISVGKSEGLSKKEVMEVVKRHVGEIQGCYERALLSNPGLAGKVEYEWDIEPKGSVTAVRVLKSDVQGGDALNSCVMAVFKKMKFPVATNGQSTTPNIPFPFGRL